MQADEHVDGAILPDIAYLGDNLYVSVPFSGQLRVVSLDRQRKALVAVTERHDIGGLPTRMVVAQAAPHSHSHA